MLFVYSGRGSNRVINDDTPRLDDVLADLILAWYENTIFASSVDDFRTAPEIREIASFGYSAAPKIVQELREQPSYLFLSLEMITGENPIEDQDRGNVEAMCKAWISWYKNHKLAFV